MSIYNAYLTLSGALDTEVVRDEKLARRTSFRIGGPATLTVTAHTYPALARAIDVLDREQVSWVVLGRGTNLLVADTGYDGCVVRLGREFSHFSIEEDGQASAGAAVVLSRLVSECQSEGLSGLEICVGIPGTVGGAISMNAGTKTEWIGKRVSSVVTFVPGTGLRRYEGSDIEWGYRSTSIPGGEIILEASFALTLASPEDISAEMERRLLHRRKRQPLGKPTCGSVFRNPPGKSAGELVELCGLKGVAFGGAQISETHANFVENNGRATALDVLAAIRRMHDDVFDRYGIDMVPEVKFLGFE